MPTEQELTLARLKRIERLIKDLEQQREQSEKQRELFQKLKARMTAVRLALKQRT